MRANSKTIQELAARLDELFPDNFWVQLLVAIALLGIADSLQIRSLCEMERTKLTRMIDTIQTLGSGFPPIIQILDHTIPRAGQRGRLPLIYTIGETGVALLHAKGYPDVHTCNLTDDHSRAHALTILDTYISARRHGLETQIDKVITYRDTERIRPDLQVTLKNGETCFVEVEQMPRRDLFPRMMDSLRNRHAFFESQEGKKYCPNIRLVLNVPTTKLSKARHGWRNVAEQLEETLGRKLSFRVYGISLVDFLQDPEWDSEELSPRWVELTRIQEPERASITVKVDRSNILRVTENSEEDLVLIEAYDQVYDEEIAPEEKRIDVNMLKPMLRIYRASHPKDRNHPLWLKPPRKSIFLLSRYLDNHPELKSKLSVAIHRDEKNQVWTPKTIVLRIQKVIDVFLANYGWRTNMYLDAKVVSNSDSDPIRITVSTLGNFWGEYEESTEKLEALEWVITALFKHAEMIGMGKPKFW